MNMTQCSDSAASGAMAASLVQCVHKETGKQYTKMRVSAELKHELAKLKHPKSVNHVKNAIVTPSKNLALLQKERNLRSAKYSPDQPGAPNTDGFDYGTEVLPAAVDPNLEEG